MARFQIVTSAAFAVLGAIILARAAAEGVWFGCIYGAVMLAFGLYRSRAIVRALRERDR